MPVSRRRRISHSTPPSAPPAQFLTTRPPVSPSLPDIPSCSHCGESAPAFYWQLMRDGRIHLRVECSRCRKFIKFATQVEPYVTYADNAPTYVRKGVHHAY